MTVIYNNNLGSTIIKMINRGLWWGGGGVETKISERPNWNNAEGHQTHEYC